MSGWTIEPFAGQQSAIDWLCTRAAVRLGIITSPMATEIASVIESRLQYDDLWALSRDIATLSLLNSSAFSVDMETIDRSLVLSALGSTPFSNGWYNSTELWQPVFTAQVLEMVSILGLRTQLYSIAGSTLSVNVPASAQIGDFLLIDVAISSPETYHTVYINAFGDWVAFENVLDADTLSLTVPSTPDTLGSWQVSAMVADWGFSRSYDSDTVIIQDSLIGSLDVSTPSVLMSDLINATIDWTLSGGSDAGATDIFVELIGDSYSDDWSYSGSSPYSLSLPTTGAPAGSYDLRVTLTRPYCSPLLLAEPVSIEVPDVTYLSSTSSLSIDTNQVLDIPWSLHFLSNDSTIPEQLVQLEIFDETYTLVYFDSGVSSSITEYFQWTTSIRGSYSFTLSFARNGTLELSSYSGTISVYEPTVNHWVDSSQRDQYTTGTVCVQLTTLTGSWLSGEDVHITISSPSSAVLVDTILTTNSTGYVSVSLTFSENGIYLLYAEFIGHDYLESSSVSDGLVSWSTTDVEVGGISSEVLITDSWTLWSRMIDSLGLPVSGQPVTLRITYLPSTIVLEQTLTTNGTGHISYDWSAASSGQYRIEAVYEGALSRGTASSYVDSDILIPVTLSVQLLTDAEVGIEVGIRVDCEDHTGTSISDLTLSLVVRDPSNAIIFTDSGVSQDGTIIFLWIPSIRGDCSISVSSSKQATYDAAQVQIQAPVYEHPTLLISFDDTPKAPDIVTLTITVQDHLLLGIEDVSIHVMVRVDGTPLVDTTDTTSGDGTLDLPISFSNPGDLSLTVSLPDQGWLLSTSNISSGSVYARTDITLNVVGLPIQQGTTLGITAILTDWDGLPMIGATVTLEVSLPNGSVVSSRTGITGAGGSCSHAHEFSTIGDYWIRAYYDGSGLNASSSDEILQRVHVTPNLILQHSTSVLLGETVSFWIGVYDIYGASIVGHNLSMIIELSGEIALNTFVTCADELVLYEWTPEQKGFATITLSEQGTAYYLANSTESSLSVLQVVQGSLAIETSPLDLFDSTYLYYSIINATPDVSILFEVLGADLVPVWSTQTLTNGSGMAVATYLADDMAGILIVRAEPVEDQFLIGGVTQDQLIIRTHVHVTTDLEPEVAALGATLNISIDIVDDLGVPMDGLDIALSLYDPKGDPIKLGTFTFSIILTLVDGTAIASFEPEESGLYTVRVESSGSLAVYSFSVQELHTVYSPTDLELYVDSTEVMVNDTVHIEVQLIDITGAYLIGKTVILELIGPYAIHIGPVNLVTNATGCVVWSTELGDNGHWTLTADFAGIGVYLPSGSEIGLDVKHGTSIDVTVIDNGELIANLIPLSVTVLLEDDSHTAVELGEVSVEAFHDMLGSVLSDSVTQYGYLPEGLNISLPYMGNYTIVFSFAGSGSYHPSNTALRVWVRGTTSLLVDGPEIIERTESSSVSISVLDESLEYLTLGESDILLTMLSESGAIDLINRLEWSTEVLSVSLYGIPVGTYSLTIDYPETALRIGASMTISFNVTSTSTLSIVEGSLFGLIGTEHTMVFLLADSMNDTLDDVHIGLSLFSPDGREIYGSPLTQVTYTDTIDGSVTLSWNPSRVGNYSLRVTYPGSEYIVGCEITVDILTRYGTELSLEVTESVTYPDSASLDVTLVGGLGKITEAPVTITVMNGDIVVHQEIISTNALGTIQLQLIAIAAGSHVVTASYAGSDIYSPITTSVPLTVLPLVKISLEPRTNLYVGYNVSLAIELDLGGISSSWVGTLQYELHGPSGLLLSRAISVGPTSEVIFNFMAAFEGDYRVNVTLLDIPLIGNLSDSYSFGITPPSISIPMDTGTTSMAGGTMVLALIGYVAKRRMGGMLETLPTEWEG
ncbi:MAG: Ig-like domain-containing protein [Candidatus Thorarchaeota archaeon]